MNYCKIDINKVEERYEIYENGDIFDKKRRKYCKKYLDSKGYHIVRIANIGKNIRVHRLVLCKYCPTENQIFLQVNHKNGIKTDNNLDNLEWCTQPENQSHEFKNGLNSRCGTRNSQSKSTEKFANVQSSKYKTFKDNLMKDLEDGMDLDILSKKYHLSKRYIRDFKYRKLGIY